MTMARTVDEWIGRSDDDVPPPRVRVRVFDRFKGRCRDCRRRIHAGEKWTLEHVHALCNGGENRESNLGLTCSWCLPDKNAADVAMKSETAKMRKKHLGVEGRKSRPMAGTIASGWRKPMNGRAVRR